MPHKLVAQRNLLGLTRNRPSFDFLETRSPIGCGLSPTNRRAMESCHRPEPPHYLLEESLAASVSWLTVVATGPFKR